MQTVIPQRPRPFVEQTRTDIGHESEDHGYIPFRREGADDDRPELELDRLEVPMPNDLKLQCFTISVKASEDQQPINNQVIGPPPYVTMQCRSSVFLMSVSQSSVFFAENQQKLVAQDQCQRLTSDQILELEHLDGGSTCQRETLQL